jgi:hypothetical protein
VRRVAPEGCADGTIGAVAIELKSCKQTCVSSANRVAGLLMGNWAADRSWMLMPVLSARRLANEIVGG